MCHRDRHWPQIEAPSKNLLCVLVLLARNGISCGQTLFAEVELVYRTLASFSLAFRNHGCSGVIVSSVLADKRVHSGTTFCLSCLLSHAAPAQFPFPLTLSTTAVSVLFQSPCKCKIYGKFTLYTRSRWI